MRTTKRAKDRGPRAEGWPRGSDAPTPALRRALHGLQEALGSISHPRAAEVRAALALADQDAVAFWRAIDSNAWWGGAGSLAAETLGDNPGLPESDWRGIVGDLRERLIEIGETLMARGRHNPGIPSWVLAFRNWNDSQV